MFRQSIQRLAIRNQSTVSKSVPRALSNAYVSKLDSRWETLPKEDHIIHDREVTNGITMARIDPCRKEGCILHLLR